MIKTATENVYCFNGYKDRQDYLRHLATEYELPIGIVKDLADVLGESEAFDGLVVALEDYADMYAGMLDWEEQA